MTIRIRLVVMCLIIALLPAIPVSMLVKALLEKSFDVGLNKDVEGALQSGLAISREHIDLLESAFEHDVDDASQLLGASADSAMIELRWSAVPDVNARFDLMLVAGASGGGEGLAPFEERSALKAATIGLTFNERAGPDGQRMFWAANRAAQIAVLQPAANTRVLLLKRTDPAFLAEAGSVLTGRQIFAQLRLAQQGLGRSFFYPFIVIYGVIVILALGLAILMAERMADPVRRLAAASDQVADGNWDVRIDVNARGEVGRLVGAFNKMVTRLDDQRARLVDMEKIAAWREIARHLAHEIKNPLLPIRLTVEELKDQYDGGDERYQGILNESVRVVGDEVDHLSNLVKEFSNFARMPALNPSPGSLREMCEDVAKLYPQLKTRIEAGDVPEFAFDHGQMRRVLTNFFDNTASVMPDAVLGQVEITITREGTDAVLAFTDNGPGIGADTLPKIFDPYFTTRQEGSGLGLAMVKNIILVHGGTIHAESREGHGTTFVVHLPLDGPPTDGEEE